MFDRWRTQTKFLAGFQHGHSGLPVGVLGTRTLCGKIMRTSGPTEYFYNAWMTAQNMYVLGHLGMIERSTGQNSRNFTNRNSRDSIEGYHLFGGKFSRLPWESEIPFLISGLWKYLSFRTPYIRAFEPTSIVPYQYWYDTGWYCTVQYRYRTVQWFVITYQVRTVCMKNEDTVNW